MESISNNKSIFVTGGAGFIGSHLVERLVMKGFKIRIFDNYARNAIKYSEILNNASVEVVEGDILDYEKLKNSMTGFKSVIHLAAIAGVSNYYNFPAKTLKTNLIGTFNVLEAMLACKINRLIDMSTSEVYGPEAIGVDESSHFRIGPPSDKRWSYASSKIGGEQLIYRYSEEYNLNATVVRPFNIYGPRQIGEGAISNFCKAIISKKKIRIEGDGAAARSWCYIDDFLDALCLLIEKPHLNTEAFNIGNSWSVSSTFTLAELALSQAKKLGLIDSSVEINELIDFVPMNFTEIKVRYPNTNKMERVYNWHAKINLEVGIFKTLKWFGENFGDN